MISYYISYCGVSSHNSLIYYDAYPYAEIPSAAECETYHTARLFTMGTDQATLTMNATVYMKTMKAGTLKDNGACTDANLHHKGK